MMTIVLRLPNGFDLGLGEPRRRLLECDLGWTVEVPDITRVCTGRAEPGNLVHNRIPEVILSCCRELKDMPAPSSVKINLSTGKV